jgi:hypothetical protein
MNCRWHLTSPCRRPAVVFYLGAFFCPYHARIIQGSRAALRGETPDDVGLAPSSGGSAQRVTGAVLSGPLDGAAPPLSEAEVLDILEHDGWREIEYDLFLEHGMTLDDLRRELEARL